MGARCRGRPGVAHGSTENATRTPPCPSGTAEVRRIQRSTKLCGWPCAYCTTFRPLNVPIAAPSTTSLAQCLSWYIRERPTAVAPAYITGPTIHSDLGHQRVVSFVTAAAAANAVVACPDGNDAQSPDVNPFVARQSVGSVPSESEGRARPATPLMTYVMPSASSTDSVPCHPRSAMRSACVSLPTMYSVPPM